MSGVLGSIPGLNNKGECMKRATLVVFCALRALCACDLGSNPDVEAATEQPVVGPVAFVTQRAPGQLAVSWSVDPNATQYAVYQSASGGAFTFAGSPQATSYIADGLTTGVTYCYAVVAVYPGGGTSAFGASACAISTAQLTIAAMAFVAEDPVHHPIDYIFGPAEGPSFAARAVVPVPVGHQIIAVRAIVGDNSTDPNAKMNLQLISINSNGTNVIASSPVSKGDGTVQTLTINTPTTVAPHTAYFLHVYALGQPSAQDALYFAEVDSN